MGSVREQWLGGRRAGGSGAPAAAAAPAVSRGAPAAALFARYRFAVAAADQIALSVFGFALTLGLVRVLSAEEFGVVSLWMAVALFAFGVQSALVNTPLGVHVAASDEESGRRLAGSLATVNLLALVVLGLAVIGINAAVDAEWAPKDGATAVAVPLFLVVGLYREYYRSVAFGRRDMAMLVLIDLPYVGVTAACLVAMVVRPEDFASLPAAFAALTLGGVASRLCLRRSPAGRAARLFARGWAPAYRQIFAEVRWSVVGVVTTHLHTRSYIYVAINLAGLAAMAAISVVGVLFRPVRTLLSAWGRLALPQMAALYATRRTAEFDRALLRAFLGAAGASVAWTGIVFLIWPLIERFFLLGRYPDAWFLILPWAISAGFGCVGYTISTALQAAREFRFLAYTTLVSAPVTIVAAAAAIWWQGYLWTMYGVAIGDAVAFLMVLGRLYVVRRRLAEPPPSLYWARR